MMRLSIIILIALISSCTTRNPSGESDAHNKEFEDLTLSEKLNVFSQIREEFSGDYRKFVGQNADSTKIVLALNLDRRFAIGFKWFATNTIEMGDSVVTFDFVNTPGFQNLCIGHWTDEGESIRLTFLLGQTDFFDSLRNEGVVNVIDGKTALLDKEAKEVWIERASCRRTP